MEDRTWVKVLSWRALPEGSTKRCRWDKDGCAEVGTFELNRAHVGHARWYPYCAAHVRTLGYRVTGKEIQVEVVLGSPAAQRGWVA
jgi:hypothetical protein